MNRKAKGLRIAGGIGILLNIIFLFLPMTKCQPENYPVERFSQLDYITKMFSDEAPYCNAYTAGRIVWVMVLILIPVIISIVAGIWGIIGDDRQIVSSIMILSVFALYIALCLTIMGFYPTDEYSGDIAGIFNLICSGAAGVLAIISLMYKGEPMEEPEFDEIPDLDEFRQDQINAKFNINNNSEKSINPFAADTYDKSSESGGSAKQPSIQVEPDQSTQQMVQEQQPVMQTEDVQDHPTQTSEQNEIQEYVPGPPKGIMVGLTGIYAGAQIQFRDGESIRLGRHQSNDLVFEGQEKVSRNHCYIKWNGVEGKFYFKDNSSNGSFIQGMEDCLPQNIEIEIPIGSVILIGDESNSFRLE